LCTFASNREESIKKTLSIVRLLSSVFHPLSLSPQFIAGFFYFKRKKAENCCPDAQKGVKVDWICKNGLVG